MKQPVALGAASFKAVGTVIALGALSHAGGPYLRQIGPPALRMEAPRIASPSVAKAETPAAAAITNVVAAPASDMATNLLSVSDVMASSNIVSVGPVSVSSESSSLGGTMAASIFDMPTPDLLGITPQMLATYFRPIHVTTNLQTAGDEFHVSFVPPLPSPPPNKSSHAEYIVK